MIAYAYLMSLYLIYTVYEYINPTAYNTLYYFELENVKAMN